MNDYDDYDHSFPSRKVVEQLDLNRLTIRLTLIDEEYKTDDLDVNRRQSGRQSSSIQYIIYFCALTYYLLLLVIILAYSCLLFSSRMRE